MKVFKKEFKKIKETLKLIKEFKDLDIKESWFYDIDRLDDEIKEKQKFLRVVKRERKLQPIVRSQSMFTKELKTLDRGYQIGVSLKGNIIYYKDWSY